MTLSEFIKLMYELIGNETLQSDFVLYLFSLIMEEPQSEEDFEADDKGKYNPLAEFKENSLSKIYSGNATLSKSNAKIILRHLDKSKFMDTLEAIGYDQTERLTRELRSRRFVCEPQETSQYVADVFEALIKNATLGRQDLTPDEITNRDEKGRPYLTVHSKDVSFRDGVLHVSEKKIPFKTKDECLSEEAPIEEQHFSKALKEVIAEKNGIPISDVCTENVDAQSEKFYNRQVENYVEALWLQHSIRDIMRSGEDIFHELEKETFSGIEEVYLDEYQIGYMRLKEVLKHVVCISLDASIIGDFQGLLNNTIRKPDFTSYIVYYMLHQLLGYSLINKAIYDILYV